MAAILCAGSKWSSLLSPPSKAFPRWNRAGKCLPPLLPKRTASCFPLHCSIPNKPRGPSPIKAAEEDAVASSKAEETEKELKEGRLRRVEGSLAKLFGGPVWFLILILFLTVFGGLYGYLIFNFADVADVPILGVTR
eukprot:c21594_g1_i1 orf=88-498(+)